MQKVMVFKDKKLASDFLALIFSGLIEQNNSKNLSTILGFATGVTPLQMYEKIIAIHNGTFLISKEHFFILKELSRQFLNIDFSYLLSIKQENIDGLKIKPVSWNQVITFNLDEFVGLNKIHQERFSVYMNNHLFDHLDLKAENINFINPDNENLINAAKEYELKITAYQKEIMQLITLGINGHIAYNEPGTAFDSQTHVVKLSNETKKNLFAQGKFPNLHETPNYALTVGLKTILKMNRVVMVAFGAEKAEMTRKMLDENISSQVPASILQRHKNCIFILDKAASIKLKDNKKYQFVYIE